MDSEILSKCIEYIEIKKNDMLNDLLNTCQDNNKLTIFNIENNIYDIAIKNNNIDAFNILLYHDIECDNFMEDSSFFNIKKLKYLINKGYKASTRFINLIIKNKGNEGVDLLKLIFQNINYNNEIIINFLFHCKNKLPFSQAELNNIVNKENEKLRNILNTRERRFIDYGANVNVGKCENVCQSGSGCCSNYIPLLIIAIRNEDESIVKYLIEHGADINNGSDNCICGATREEYTPLGVACMINNKFIIKCLIEHGADINGEIEEWGNIYTPLIYACRKGNENLVKYLIENGADVNTKKIVYEEINGRRKCKVITPLSVACEKENKSIIKLLIESGVNNIDVYINKLLLDNEFENGNGYLKLNKDIYDIEIQKNFKDINKKNKNKPKNRKNNIKNNNNNKKRMRIKKEIKKKTQMKKLKK
eukprot:jgi/Orpsp1_1/1187360/evm.model.d7180000057144.1